MCVHKHTHTYTHTHTHISTLSGLLLNDWNGTLCDSYAVIKDDWTGYSPPNPRVLYTTTVC